MEEKKVHPLVDEAQSALAKGQISRREFLRISTLLGVSLTSANILAACGVTTPTATAVPATAAPTAVPTPTAPAIPRGGVLNVACRVERVSDPAQFSLVSASHPWRHVFEYLTHTDPQGITHPYLLDSWKASDDLLTWTLVLKQGIKFNNGQELTADDVVFNIKRWLDPNTKSSMLSAMSYMDGSGVEKTDKYTVTLHLKNPTIFLPDNLGQYQAAIVPATFGGDITKEPIGTGPFTMVEYVATERAHLKARADYWQMGVDGKPLPYLDEIVMVMLGEDQAAYVSALQSGQVDTILEPTVSTWEAVKDDKRFTIVSTPTAATRVLRLRVDQEPWTKNEVRQALKYCHNREKILQLALQGQGVIGNDTHVTQANPEYAKLDPLPFDTAKSKALLAQAGYPDGVTVELTVASDWPESMAYAQALKEDAAAGGFTINLKTMPASQYWNGWTDFNMGITWWAHRTQALITLGLAYTGDADGKPGAWNESHWVDAEFSQILTEATGTLDLDARKAFALQLEKIQQDRGSICSPFFMDVWKIYTTKVHGVEPSPDEYAIFTETSKEA
ncbi:MAG: ABC transporter substrate-binding protein [Acidobacteria bacterium]|nr:ABC transporter substrate-binding protein [Acidobacteriota bacterium]